MEKIYFDRKKKLILEIGKNKESAETRYIATIIKNLESYGYILSKEITDILGTFTKEELVSFYKKIIGMVSYGKHMTPMYPNFPKQVMDMDEGVLYLNAIIHYLSEGKLLPLTEGEERFPLIDNPKLTVISLGTDEDFESIFTNLLSAKTPLSPTDKRDIVKLLREYPSVEALIPKTIPVKETLILVTNELLKKGNRDSLLRLYKTATDVLRLATIMSDGDETLSGNSKFRSFRRAERVMLLSMLENCKNIEEDMVRYKNKWIRLGERLHPSEYKKFVKVNKAFSKIRNNEKIITFNSKLEKALKEKNIDVVLDLLIKRPGEFARRLNEVLTISPTMKVVYKFASIAEDIPTAILLNLMEYFKYRNQIFIRVFFPKGNISKAYGLETEMKILPENIRSSLVEIIWNVLLERFRERKPLGKVFIDENLKNYAIPLSQRNSSKGVKTIARGSKLRIREGISCIRAFVHWENMREERVDLDLNAIFFNEDFTQSKIVAYTNLRESDIKCYHSGDMQNAPAPEGATEYIDIDISSALEKGYRYAAITINSYTGQSFKDVPSFMGYMEREDCNSGEIFEPKTVSNKIDLNSDCTQLLPMIIDLEKNRIIWADLAIKRVPYFSNNAENNKNSSLWAIKAMVNANKPNMYDLALLHASARASAVTDNIDEADTVFGLDQDKGITPYDSDVIISELL